MEGHSDEVSNAGGGGGGGIPASPRWNPTKEQISMLENWYKQGIRTPTAEQIQQITARLQAYGHIEGKNVFYWFQNHKARQRQKQKQESLAFFSRCFQNNKPASSLPVFSPSPNVVCSPCYPAQSELGFYSHYPKMLQQGLIKRRPKPDKLEMIPTSQVPLNDDDSSCKQETLPLFPLEPTGIFSQTRSSSSSSSLASTSAVISTAPSSSSTTINGGLGDHQPYFDFFAGSGRCDL